MSVKFVATIAGVNGPVGKDEDEAVVRLREYMESHIGKRHFQETNPDCDEQQYQETLWKLYGREEGKDFEAISNGTDVAKCEPTVSEVD
jgi:hypothetical protein